MLARPLPIVRLWCGGASERQAHEETGLAHLPLPDVLQQIFHIIPMFGLLRGRR